MSPTSFLVGILSADSVHSFLSLALGFAVAGLLATGYHYFAEQPPSFRLVNRGPQAATFAAVAFLIFAGGAFEVVSAPTALPAGTWSHLAATYDGSQVRLPFITITTANGEPMEMSPRPVDEEMVRDLGEDARGVDTQLELAVKVLLQEMSTEKGAADDE